MLQKYPVVYFIANDNTVKIVDPSLEDCYDEDSAPDYLPNAEL